MPGCLLYGQLSSKLRTGIQYSQLNLGCNLVLLEALEILPASFFRCSRPRVTRSRSLWAGAFRVDAPNVRLILCRSRPRAPQMTTAALVLSRTCALCRRARAQTAHATASTHPSRSAANVCVPSEVSLIASLQLVHVQHEMCDAAHWHWNTGACLLIMLNRKRSSLWLRARKTLVTLRCTSVEKGCRQ